MGKILTAKEMEQAIIIADKCSEPEYFSKNIIGFDLWEKQKEIARSVWVNKNTSVRSCYGSGKSHIAAELALWFLCTHQPSKVITTAPSWTQVEKILWTEISKCYNKARVPLGGKLLLTELKIEDDWFAMGLSPKIDVDSEAERFQGFHAPYVLVILDEAAGISNKLWQAAKGLILSNNCRILAIGNPSSKIGRFFHTFKDPNWHNIHINAFETPNVIAKKEIIPGLITWEWIEERRKDWGETHPLWISKVLGDFPEETEEILILLAWVDKAKNATKEAMGPKGLGVDVARFGADKTVFTFMHGAKVVEIQSFQGKDTMKTVGKTIQMMYKYDIPAKCVCIDDCGVGGGVTDRLHEEGHMIQPINAGNTADDSEQFFNKSAEMYWDMRKKFEVEDIQIPNDENIIAQLPGRKYSLTSTGKIKIETKDEMKKRGLKSPDHTDSLVLAIHGQKFHNASDSGPSITVIETRM